MLTEEPDTETTSEESAPEPPAPKVSKTLKARGSRKAKGEDREHPPSGYFQTSAADSLIVRERRASPEQRQERERPLYNGPDRGGRRDEGQRDAKNTSSSRREQRSPEQRQEREHPIIASHLRKCPINKAGRPEPPNNNSCFWCSTEYTNGLTIRGHQEMCPSRKRQVRACRGCHKEFKCPNSPPFMSTEYVRHICNCSHLRCRTCTVDNHHDVMVCPAKHDGCAYRGQASSCRTGHMRGFCKWDKELTHWLRSK